MDEAAVAVVFHYLDDFLLIGAPKSAECAHALSILLHTFQYLGLPIAMDKLEGPIPWLIFLNGLELDSRVLEIRFPANKLADLQSLVSSWLNRRPCYCRELETLVGHLGFACKVMQSGKAFLRRMF